MKRSILILNLVCWFSLMSYAQSYVYPTILPGDVGYNIVGAPLGAYPEVTGTTFGWQSDCQNVPRGFNFSYPNRDRDPDNNRFTMLKYSILEQNWQTGDFTVRYSSPDWQVGGGLANVDEFLFFSTTVNDNVEIVRKPFCRYYIKVQTKKGRINIWGNVGLVNWSSLHTGFTETMNFGVCSNGCIPLPWGSLTLGNLNSSAANQAAGFYNPLYETGGPIVSTTHLSSSEQLILDAGESVTLLPGFHAEYGSDFVAYIDGCGGRVSEPNQEGDENLNHEFHNDDAQLKEVASSFEISEEISAMHFTLYPNPSNGKFFIKFNKFPVDGMIMITSLNGNLVFKKQLVNLTSEIDINDYVSGVYFVKVIDQQGVTTQKIIKQ